MPNIVNMASNEMCWFFYARQSFEIEKVLWMFEILLFCSALGIGEAVVKGTKAIYADAQTLKNDYLTSIALHEISPCTKYQH